MSNKIKVKVVFKLNLALDDIRIRIQYSLGILTGIR